MKEKGKGRVGSRQHNKWNRMVMVMRERGRKGNEKNIDGKHFNYIEREEGRERKGGKIGKL